MTPTAVPSQALRAAWRASVLAAIALLLFVALMSGGRETHLLTALLLSTLSVIAAVRIFRIANAWSFEHDLFSPVVAFPIAYVLWFALGSIDWIEAPSIFSFGLFDPIPKTMWAYYGLGIAGYLCGTFALRSAGNDIEKPSQWDLRRTQIVVVGLCFMILVCWIALAAQFGVPGLRSSAAELRLRVRGPFYLLFLLTAWTAFLFIPVSHWQSSKKGRTSILWILVFAIAILLSSFAGRSNIFVPLLTLIIARHYCAHRINLSRILAVGLVLFVALSLFGYARDFAESEDSLDWLPMVGIPQPLVPVAYAGVYVRYSIATFRDVTQMIPAHVPFQHGAISLAPFRTFLPGHQEMSDVFFKNLLGNDFVGVGQPATLLAPFYADFGTAGVFFGMVGYGLLVAICYRKMKQRAGPLRILMYAWVLQSGLFGLFANVFPYITTILVPLAWLGLDRLVTVREQAPGTE